MLFERIERFQSGLGIRLFSLRFMIHASHLPLKERGGAFRTHRTLPVRSWNQAVFAPARDPCIPSPLAGEGQGEGETITRERSEHLSSKLFKPWLNSRIQHPHGGSWCAIRKLSHDLLPT